MYQRQLKKNDIAAAMMGGGGGTGGGKGSKQAGGKFRCAATHHMVYTLNKWGPNRACACAGAATCVPFIPHHCSAPWRPGHLHAFPRPPPTCCCSKEELAQLFTLLVDTRCDTAQILREAAGKARAAAAAAGGAAVLAKGQRGRCRQQLVDDDEDEEDGGRAAGGVVAEEDPAVAAAAEAAAEFKVGQPGGQGGFSECW